LRGAAVVPEKVIALLAMEMNEKVILGSELSGDIVVRDVPQLTVSFEAHRLIDPSGDLEETRRLLMRRAYDNLIKCALKRITMTKSERKYLERRRALLQSKLALLEKGGWSFEETGPADSSDIPGLEEQIGQIETQLLEIGGDDRVLEVYLDMVIEVLGRPGEHLWGQQETLILDSMGIKRNQVASNAHEMTFSMLYNSEGQRMVLLLVALSGEELRSIYGE
jgi:hypothetical protein